MPGSLEQAYDNLPYALAKMTSNPVAGLGLTDLGTLREGTRANICVFRFGQYRQ